MKEVSTSSWQAKNIASTEILSDLVSVVNCERAQLATRNPKRTLRPFTLGLVFATNGSSYA